MSNPISAENQHTGTTDWQITQATITAWQMYANTLSVDPGGSLTFYISTQFAGRGYQIDIFRLGYYGGTGGCLKQTISGLSGQAQGYYDGTTLQSCPTAIIDSTTHLIEAGWASSYTLAIPTNWITGCYLAKVTDALGYQTSCYFIVRGNASADYAYVHGAMTDCAYNDWGGYSLYTNPTVGVKVSFNRPMMVNYGGSNLVGIELPLIHWLEYMGYNLSYLADVDIHATPSLLLSSGAVISPCHDEYWSYEKRGAYEGAIAAGAGAAFLGANSCYWQVRLENDAASHPNRTVVCYKVQSASNNLALDPQYGVANTKVTTNWRDPLLSRPESRMIGPLYSGSTTNGTNVSWTVDASATSPYLTGTGLVPGQSYGTGVATTDLVGNEWDKVDHTSPGNIVTIGSTVTFDHNRLQNDTSNTTTYISASGSLVFAAGSICWTWGLDTYRAGTTVAAIPGMQQLMAHIMTALIRPKNPTGFSSFASGHR